MGRPHESPRRRRRRLSKRRRILLAVAAGGRAAQSGIQSSDNTSFGNTEVPIAEIAGGTEISANASNEDDLATAKSVLVDLPRSVLLNLRRELALSPFADTLRSLATFSRSRANSMAQNISEAVDDARLKSTIAMLQTVGADVTARALSELLGPRLRCWAYSGHADITCAGQAILQHLSEDRRCALLAALRRGESFCASVRRNVGRHDGRALLKLGRTRVVWLLGGTADDVAFQLPDVAPESRHRKIRRPKVLKLKDWSNNGDSDPELLLHDGADADTEASTDAGDDCDATVPLVAERTGAARAQAVAGTANGRSGSSSGAEGELLEGVRVISEDSSDGDRHETLAFLRAFRERRRLQQEQERALHD